MGPCLRAFHMHCLRLEAPVEEPWFCPECQTGRVRCFVCGDFSTGMDDPHVRKCSLGVCGRFYHMTYASILTSVAGLPLASCYARVKQCMFKGLLLVSFAK